MSFRIPGSQGPFYQSQNYFNSDLNPPNAVSPSLDLAHPVNLDHVDPLTSAKALNLKVLEIFDLDKEIEWPCLEAFFYRFIEHTGMTYREVLSVIKEGDMDKGAWLSLSEEIKRSTRLISGVGRFFKHQPKTADFSALIAYTLFNPWKRLSNPELITRLISIFEAENTSAPVDLCSMGEGSNNLRLASSYLHACDMDFWDSIDEFEGLICLFDMLHAVSFENTEVLDEDVSSREKRVAQEKVDRVLNVLVNSPNHVNFLRALQQDPLFREHVQSTIEALFMNGKNFDAVLAEILAITYRMDAPEESRELTLWLLDIAAAFPSSSGLLTTNDKLLPTLRSLKEALSTLSPESMRTTIKIYGPLPLCLNDNYEQKVQRLLADDKKLLSVFAMLGNIVQILGNSAEAEEIHRAIFLSMSRCYQQHGEEVAERIFESFFKSLSFQLTDRKFLLLTLKLFPILTEGVTDPHITALLFNHLYSFVKRDSEDILDTDLLESELRREIDNLSKLLPNYKTDFVEASSFILATCIKLPPNHLDKNIELIKKAASVFGAQRPKNFAKFMGKLRTIQSSSTRLKVFQSLESKVQTSCEQLKDSNITDQQRSRIEQDLTICMSKKLTWMSKISSELLSIPKEKVSLALTECLLDLFADNNSADSFCGFYDILYRQKETERVALISRFVEFMRPLKTALPPDSRLALFYAISAIKGDPEPILGVLQAKLVEAEKQKLEKQVTRFFQNLSLMPLQEWVIFFSTIQPIKNLSSKTVTTHAKKTMQFRNMLLEHLPQVYWLPYPSIAKTTSRLGTMVCDDLKLPAQDPIRYDATRIQHLLVEGPVEKNPYYVYRSLLANIKAPVTPLSNPPSHLVGKTYPLELTWNQQVLQEKGLVKTWFASSLPKGLSRAKFEDLFNKMQARVKALPEEKRPAVEQHIAALISVNPDNPHEALQTLRNDFFNSSLFENFMNGYAQFIAGSPHAEVNENLVQFALIAKKILDSSILIQGEDPLSVQENILIKFAMLLKVCTTGQNDGLNRFFNTVFQGTDRVASLYSHDTDAEFSKLVDESVQSALEDVFEDSSFICNLANDKKTGQLSHQTQYLKARWHRVVGLKYGTLPFDKQSHVLHINVVKATSGTFQKKFFKFFTPAAVIKKILKASEDFKKDIRLYNKFTALLENQNVLPPESEPEQRMAMLKKCVVFDPVNLDDQESHQECIVFDSDDAYVPIRLTSFGAIMALKALKYMNIKELTSKRSLILDPTPLEPTPKRSRHAEEKAEIDGEVDHEIN